jgi:hypothetical protein
MIADGFAVFNGFEKLVVPQFKLRHYRKAWWEFHRISFVYLCVLCGLKSLTEEGLNHKGHKDSFLTYFPNASLFTT